MIILQETASSQELWFIPREYTADTMIIYDEVQRTSVTINITPLISTYYMVVTSVLALKENRYYTLKVKNGSRIVYNGRIFCTNQNSPDYSVNDGKYVQHSSDNSFIVI